MLGKRLSKPRQAVSLYDPAFFEFTADQRERYQNTRDITILGDLTKLPNPPTVITLDPARPEHQHLLDLDDITSRTLLFRMYATAIDHSDVQLDFEDTNGVRRLSEACALQFGWEVCAEWGSLVQQFARCDTTPFTQPDSYTETVRGMLIRRAQMSVKTEPAASSDADGSTTTD